MGVTYTNAKITRVEPDGITLTHSRGIAKIPFQELSDEIQKAYNYDPAKAASYRGMTIQAQAEWERQHAAATQQQLTQRQKHLDAIKNKETQHETEEKARSSAETCKVEILQILDGGCLAIPIERVWQREWDGSRIHEDQYKDQNIFIEGIPSNLVDGDTWQGRIAPNGVYQYGSISGAGMTVRKYKVVQ